jgi:hypothetical protein
MPTIVDWKRGKTKSGSMDRKGIFLNIDHYIPVNMPLGPLMRV